MLVKTTSSELGEHIHDAADMASWIIEAFTVGGVKKLTAECSLGHKGVHVITWEPINEEDSSNESDGE